MAGSRPRGPRLEIPKSRVKLAAEMLPVLILLPIFSAFVLGMEPGWRQMLSAGFLLFLWWGAISGAHEIWRRPVLILTPSGFRVSPRDKVEVLWTDVTGFSLGRRNIRYMQWFRPVLFDYRPDRIPEPKGWLEVPVKRMFGSPTAGWILGHNWDRSPDEVAKTLEFWRKRYG